MAVARRWFLALPLAILTRPMHAVAQPPTIVRVGVLNPGSATESPALQREPFERGLRELGWTPGANIVIEHRYGDGSATRLAGAAAELVRLNVRVIVARGPIAVRAAQQAAPAVPIVMSSSDDPVAWGFVKTLARPGGNITGIANLLSELTIKRLQLLKEALPGLARVAILVNPADRPARYANVVADVAVQARSHGVDARVFEVAHRDAMGATFADIQQVRCDAILVLADTQVLEPNRAEVVALATKHRLPAMYPWRFYTDLGGLMSYATSIPHFNHRSATFVDRILRGAKPGDLPVEQPTKFEFVVNVKTARALGLTIPSAVLLRADEVIE